MACEWICRGREDKEEYYYYYYEDIFVVLQAILWENGEVGNNFADQESLFLVAVAAAYISII